MRITTIKTRAFIPPKDDIFNLFNKYIHSLKERDVLVISSKIVSIHQGRCIPIDKINKKNIVIKEADAYLPAEFKNVPSLTIKNNTFIGSAGIDESNAKGHYILWPENPSIFAKEAWIYLTKKFGVKKLGVIIVDSHCTPMRLGTTGISIGFFGIEPVLDHSGKKDIFHRKFKYSRTNVVDALASAAVLAMGETNEKTPICIIEGLHMLKFTNKFSHKKFIIEPKEDMYYPLLKSIVKKRKK